jgi:hypothetical protein
MALRCTVAPDQESQWLSGRGTLMDDDVHVPEQMRAAAQKVMALFRERNDVHLALDLESVRWIDGYINRVRENFPGDKRSGLVAHLAAFVGECIIKVFGGCWSQDENGMWGVSVTERIWACWLAKIDEQFENGPEDSVASFVEVIPTLDQHLAKRSTE